MLGYEINIKLENGTNITLTGGADKDIIGTVVNRLDDGKVKVGGTYKYNITKRISDATEFEVVKYESKIVELDIKIKELDEAGMLYCICE